MIFISGLNQQKKYVDAIQLLEKLITGKFIERADDAEKNLYSLIKLSSKNDTVSTLPYESYFVATFENMLKQINPLWINEHSMKCIKHKQLKQWIEALCSDNKLSVNLVQQFGWTIKGNEYKQFQRMPRKYIKSRTYTYQITKKK
eukprot:180041_1